MKLQQAPKSTYKSKAIALVGWDTFFNTMDISYHTELKILGFRFTNSVNTTTDHNWTAIISRMRATAQAMYNRDLSFD